MIIWEKINNEIEKCNIYVNKILSLPLSGEKAKQNTISFVCEITTLFYIYFYFLLKNHGLDTDKIIKKNLQIISIVSKKKVQSVLVVKF